MTPDEKKFAIKIMRERLEDKEAAMASLLAETAELRRRLDLRAEAANFGQNEIDSLRRTLASHEDPDRSEGDGEFEDADSPAPLHVAFDLARELESEAILGPRLGFRNLC